MKVFVDNDLILKLSACNLLDEAINSLSLDISNLQILPRAKYVLSSNKVKKIYPQNIIDEAIYFVNKCALIQTNQSNVLENNTLPRLQKIMGIDVGEERLITAALQHNSFYLLTGDKRCLEALSKNLEIRDIHQKLKGKCICLEQIILNLIYMQGFEKILEKVLPVRQYDTALRAIFGSGEKATQDNVMRSLHGYIQDLQDKSNGLLVELDKINRSKK